MADLTPEQRERLLRAAGPQTPSTAANLLAVVADLIAEARFETLRRTTDWLIGTTTIDGELDNLE